jgi:ABC-type transport system involved in multi-copper enzyme maturation permease subunit
MTARVYRALIVDTFQEAMARWLFWGLFALSSLLVLIFLFVLRIDLVQGAISVTGVTGRSHQVEDIRHFVNISYSWVSTTLYIWGTFVAVFASSGLIPSVLEPGRISLLLSKPISRTTLLLGRYAGNLLVVLLNHLYLIGSIWIILGIKTGIWDTRFLLSIPVSLFAFSVLLCVVVLIGVMYESAALSTMSAIALMLISTILAQRSFVLRLLDSEWSRQLWQALYWIVPKIFDLGNALRQIILLDKDADLLTPVLTSAAFGLAVMLRAVYVFRRKDF